VTLVSVSLSASIGTNIVLHQSVPVRGRKAAEAVTLEGTGASGSVI